MLGSVMRVLWVDGENDITSQLYVGWTIERDQDIYVM